MSNYSPIDICANVLVGKNRKISLEKCCFTYASHTDLFLGTLDSQTFAFKRWRVNNTQDETMEDLLKALAKCLEDWKSVSSHPNILAFAGLYDNGTRIPMLVMPRVRWNIARYIAEIHSTDKLVLMYQLSDSLAYLHKQHPPIIHGNIRDSNILISEDHRLLLSDIGTHEPFLTPEISREWELGDRPRWEAPEQLLRDESLETSCDVWGFGMIVLQVCTGNVPYSHLRHYGNVIVSITQGQLPQRPEKHLIDDGLWQMLVNCWKRDPHDRPNMETVSLWIRLLREQRRARL